MSLKMAGLREEEGEGAEQEHALQEPVAAPKTPCDRLRLHERRAPDFLVKDSRPAQARGCSLTSVTFIPLLA